MIRGLTPAQTRALTAANAAASSLSFAGSAFIVLCYLLFRDLRKFSFKLVFYLSLSDMLCSCFNMLGDPGNGALCYIQGYATQFFWIASFLWTTTIAFTLHRTVVRHLADVEQLGPYFHAYVWGTSLLMTAIPFIGNDYGPAGAWCWIQNEKMTGKVLRFLTFYIPLWSAIIFNGTVYYQVIRMLSFATRMAAATADRQKQVEIRADMKTLNRLGYYPLILIGSWTFGTINRIHNFIEPDRPLFWLYCLHYTTAALMGLFNSIAYGFNATVRRTLREKLSLYWPDHFQSGAAPQAQFIRLDEALEEGGGVEGEEDKS
eukprot:SM000134S26943  [mRNA]  locus=s134:202027:204822:+ [translate_table: standard]